MALHLTPLNGVHLLGTIHVSETSTEHVTDILDETNPDIIAVELDHPRAVNLYNSTSRKEQAINSIKTNPHPRNILATLVLTYISHKLDTKFELTSGVADMKPALEYAYNHNKPAALIDPVGDMQTALGNTLPSDLKTLFGQYLTHKLTSTITPLDELDALLTKYTQQYNPDSVLDLLHALDQTEITTLFDTFKDILPGTFAYMIEERNLRMAGHLLYLFEHNTTVTAVLGKAHIPGIAALLNTPAAIPREYIREPPKHHHPSDIP